MITKNAKTCIIATLGPASSDPETIARLIDAGANVFRLNFSHGEHEHHAASVKAIREHSGRTLRPIGILQDLQGPKLRVRRFAEGKVELVAGNQFAITCDDPSPGNDERVGVSYEGLFDDVRVGERMLLDDGKLELKVTSLKKRVIGCEVVRGGILSDRKGINIPGCDLSVPALPDKDVEDLKLGAELDVDWVAMSFVRNRDDVNLARHYLNRFGSRAKLMAKIEKPSAVAAFDNILDAADGVMIARGDLGVELSAEQVPIEQKKLIRKARIAGKPVVTATQMLESMTHNATPTRAEASDVANAIFDGTDGVMLSAETATGNYPVEAVAMMNRIAMSVEKDKVYRRSMQDFKLTIDDTVADSVADAACKMARTVNAKVLICYSSSGATALRVARHRIPKYVLCLTPNERAYRQLSTSWGIDALMSDGIHSSDEMVAQANHWILQTKVAKPGDRFVITAGVPFGVTGTTNLIRVEVVQKR